MEECKSCKFYSRPNCHKYPPTLSGDYSSARFIKVDETDWCGEWKSKTQFLNEELIATKIQKPMIKG